MGRGKSSFNVLSQWSGALQGPKLPALSPSLGPVSFTNLQTAMKSQARPLGDVGANVVGAATLSGKGVALPNLQNMGAFGTMLLPIVQMATNQINLQTQMYGLPNSGGWYNFAGPNLSAVGIGFLSGLEQNFGPGKVSTGGLLSSLEPAANGFQADLINLGKSLQEMIARSREAGKQDPLAMQVSQMWASETAELPQGTQIVKNFLAKLFAVADFAWGILDTVTGGLTAKIRGLFDLGNFGPDTSSSAYRGGQVVGQVINISLTFVGGPVGMFVQGVQLAAGVWNLVDAVREGDWLGAAQTIFSMGVSAARFASSCLIANSVTQVAGEALGRGAALAANTMLVINVGVGTYQGVTQMLNGDVVGGLLTLGQVAADAYHATKSCFTGDTKLMARGSWGCGYRRIDELTDDDEVLSRPEDNPNGPLAWKKVEQKFVNYAQILHLHVEGYVIRTTAEHPFWVKEHGWKSAGELRAGDLLATDNGQWASVEETFDTSEFETVYNLQVADWHTYFVGDNTWKGIWAHNDYKGQDIGSTGAPRSRRGAFRDAKVDAGIPRSQQPEEVRRAPLTDRNNKAVIGSDGRPVITREYRFERPDGSSVWIQDHGAGHQFGEGGVGDQGPHFNVRPSDPATGLPVRNGRVPGTQEHYPFG